MMAGGSGDVNTRDGVQAIPGGFVCREAAQRGQVRAMASGPGVP